MLYKIYIICPQDLAETKKVVSKVAHISSITLGPSVGVYRSHRIDKMNYYILPQGEEKHQLFEKLKNLLSQDDEDEQPPQLPMSYSEYHLITLGI